MVNHVHTQVDWRPVAICSAAAIDAQLEQDWRALCDNALWSNPFYRPEMLLPAMRAGGADGAASLLLVRSAKSGRLIGLAPVVRDGLFGRMPIRHWRTWRHAHLFTGTPLVAAGEETAFFLALRDWLSGDDNDARFVRLNCFHASPKEIKALSAGVTVFTERQWRRAKLNVGQDSEAVFASAYTAKKRKELRRQWRRLEETGDVRVVSTGRLDGVSDGGRVCFDAVIEDYIELERRGWKSSDGASVTDPASARFFKDSMAAMFARGDAMAVSIYQMKEAVDHAVAMAVFIRHGDEVCAFKTSYDEDYAALSPGIHVLMAATREILSMKAISCLDSCAKPDHPVADKLWPQRREMADLLITPGDPVTDALLRVTQFGAHGYHSLRSVLSGQGSK